MRRFFRRFRRDESGSIVLVEFGLVLPMLIMVMFAALHFVRAYYIMHNLVAAVREGARFAAVQPQIWDPGTGAPLPAVEASVENVVRNFYAPFGAPQLTAAQISILPRDGANPDFVTVRVANYTAVNAVFGWNITYNRQATFRWEQSPAPPAP
jgi:hypothetical protein